MITLLSADKKQFKANLHCHSTLSDGRLTPEQLKEAYKSHGYSVLSITDHERPCDHSDLTDPDFLLLTGYEVYIRQGGVYDLYGEEIHFNLFARDPHNVGMIAYDPKYCKYMTNEEKAKVKAVGSMPLPRVYSVSYINAVVEDAKRNGYIAGYNHPYWSREEYDHILAYRGFFSMEMCNYSCYVVNRQEYNGMLYDHMLRRGLRIACNSSDDNHNAEPFDSPLCDSFGGFTYILADKLDYDSIFNALESQDFYSSMGPEFREITVEGNKVTVKTSPVDYIVMSEGSKDEKNCCDRKGGKITEATFTISPRSLYIHFTAVDGWKHADTRGYFRDEFSPAG